MNLENSEISISSAKSRAFSSNYLDFLKTLGGIHVWMPYEQPETPLQETLSSEMQLYYTDGQKPSLKPVRLKLAGSLLICEVIMEFFDLFVEQ